MYFIKDFISVLKHRSFACLIISYIFQAIGFGFNYIAITWLLLEQNDNVGSLAILMIYYWLPYIILNPFSGVLIDKYNKKSIILVVNIIITLFLIGFAIPIGQHSNLNLLYILTLVMSTLMAPYHANILLVREIVPKTSLIHANILCDVIYEIGNVVGIALAGIFLAFYSHNKILLINAAFFALATIAAVFIKRISTDTLQHIRKPLTIVTIFNDFRDGVNYLKNKPTLLTIYFIQLIIMINFTTAPVLLAPYAKAILHIDSHQFSTLESCLSGGVIFGSITSPLFLRYLGLRNFLYLEISLLGLLFLLLSFTQELNSALFLYFCIGASLAIWPVVVTKAQELTKINYQGRVQSVFNALSGCIVLLFYWLIYWTSQFLSIEKLYWFETSFDTIALLLVWYFTSKKEDKLGSVDNSLGCAKNH